MTWARGFFDIDLDKVSLPELEGNWAASQHGYSRAEMEAWIDRLHEVQRLQHDFGYTPADFERLRRSAHPHERELGEAYNWFYEANDLAVDWMGDHYEITDGRHRVWLAKLHGLRTLPAHVAAPDEATLVRLRFEGERLTAEHRGREQRTPPWERRPTQEHKREIKRERG